MGHKQPPTPLQMDNAMVDAVVKVKVQPNWTKAIWLRDRECQEQFRIYWRPGILNDLCGLLDKAPHHAATHRMNVRKESSIPYIVVDMLRQEQSGVASAAAWELQWDSMCNGVMIWAICKTRLEPIRTPDMLPLHNNRPSAKYHSSHHAHGTHRIIDNNSPRNQTYLTSILAITMILLAL